MTEQTQTREKYQEGHDCENCDKVPSVIQITQSSNRLEYHGTLNLYDAMFCYKIIFPGKVSGLSEEEILKRVQFSFADADCREIKLSEKNRKYLMDLISRAAMTIDHQIQVSGARQFSGELENLLGPEKIDSIFTADYCGCAPPTPEIKKFISDYKARGEKAR